MHAYLNGTANTVKSQKPRTTQWRGVTSLYIREKSPLIIHYAEDHKNIVTTPLGAICRIILGLHMGKDLLGIYLKPCTSMLNCFDAFCMECILLMSYVVRLCRHNPKFWAAAIFNSGTR